MSFTPPMSFKLNSSSTVDDPRHARGTTDPAPRVLRPLTRLLASIGIDARQKTIPQTECLVSRLPPGTALWHAGEVRQAGCFICHGLVLRRRTDGLAHRATGVAGPGYLLGIEPTRAARHGETAEALTAVDLALFNARALAACEEVAGQIVAGPLSVACMRQCAWLVARAGLPAAARVASGLGALVATAGGDAARLCAMHFEVEDLAGWMALPPSQVRQALAELQRQGRVRLRGSAVTSIDADTLPLPVPSARRRALDMQ